MCSGERPIGAAYRGLVPTPPPLQPDAEPAAGDVGLGLHPPRHKDKLPNPSTTACQRWKAGVWGGTRRGGARTVG